MQPEVERGHDAEVAAASPYTPEQLRVLVLGGDHLPAVRGHHLDRVQVVAHEPELPLEPAASTAEREAGDTRARNPSAGNRESVFGRRRVELAPVQPSLRPHRALLRIDGEALHAAQIDADAVVAHRSTGHTVAASVHRDGQRGVAREVDGGDHVIGTRAARDQQRMPIDERVEDRPGFLVAGVAVRPYRTREARDLRPRRINDVAHTCLLLSACCLR